MMPYGFHPGYAQGGAGFAGAMLMLVCFAVVVGFVFWVIRMAMWRGGRHHMHGSMSMSDQPPAGPAASPAIEILKTRFAKGEITAEQYAEMKKMLES